MTNLSSSGGSATCPLVCVRANVREGMVVNDNGEDQTKVCVDIEWAVKGKQVNWD